MQKWCLLPIFLILSLGRVWAINETQVEELERRVSHLEKGDVKRECSQSLTPCAGPRVKRGLDIHLSADFVYWEAKVDGLIYAKTGVPLHSEAENVAAGKTHAVAFPFKPGFKGEIGWNFNHGCWDILFQYTWLYTSATHALCDPNIIPAYDSFGTSSYERYFSLASARPYLRYQIGDLELGRNYYVSRTLKLRPFIAVKGAKQKHKGRYECKMESPSSQDFMIFLTHTGYDLWGGGVRAGTNTSWQFSKCMGLYGNAALSGVWLRYDVQRKDAVVISKEGSTTPYSFLNIRDRFHSIKPVIELACGLRAQGYSRLGRYHFLLQTGWEGHMWINQVAHVANRGGYFFSNLAVHGFTAKGRFDF